VSYSSGCFRYTFVHSCLKATIGSTRMAPESQGDCGLGLANIASSSGALISIIVYFSVHFELISIRRTENGSIQIFEHLHTLKRVPSRFFLFHSVRRRIRFNRSARRGRRNNQRDKDNSKQSKPQPSSLAISVHLGSVVQCAAEASSETRKKARTDVIMGLISPKHHEWIHLRGVACRQNHSCKRHRTEQQRDRGQRRGVRRADGKKQAGYRFCESNYSQNT
jgi:hypothetical protein